MNRTTSQCASATTQNISSHPRRQDSQKKQTVHVTSVLVPSSAFDFSLGGDRSRGSSSSPWYGYPPVSAVFDITVSDLEEGAEHHIRRVNSRNGQNCTLRCRQLCFVTEKTFWGQRADLVIQKQLAAPELVGQGCHVFAGPMRFYFNRQVQPLSASFSNPRWCW